MAKLYYRWGVMSSMKSLQLIAVGYKYDSQGKEVLTMKPSIDDRTEDIVTRAGLSRKVDVHLHEYSPVKEFALFAKPDVVLIDEAQFLTEQQVLELCDVADRLDIPVIAYGLLSDFQGNLFPASSMLIAYSSKIEEIKAVCNYCSTKATMNLRLYNGIPVFEGEQVEIGDTNDSDKHKFSYKGVCRKCFIKAKRGYKM